MCVKFLEPLYRWLTSYMGAVGFILYGGGKGGSSAPPPDPALIAAQIKSMGIQDSAIESILARSAEIAPLQKEQLQFGLDSAKSAYNQSQEDRTWMIGRRGILSGAQDTMAKDAAEFNSEAKASELAGRATADVNSAFANAEGQNARAMARRGINPGSGRALAMGNQTAIAKAAALAGAATGARTSARMEGRALTDRVANSVAGYPAMSMQATSTGAGYGASGITIANTGLGGMNSGALSASGVASQMGSNATSMYNAMGNYKNGQDQIAASNDPTAALLGAGAQLGAAWIGKSDRRLKENIVLTGLAVRTGLKLYEFNYLNDPAHRFRGVMADEVLLVMPEAVTYNADGFAQVDYAMLGIEMVEVGGIAS